MDKSFQEKIKNRLYEAWEEWKPDYDDWLKWSRSLYSPDAIIFAIGEKPQIFSEYQQSMKVQRDAFIMDMGPIESCVVQGNVIAISYNMYLTQKSEIMGLLPTGKKAMIRVAEFNTFEEMPGFDKPMVVKLEVIGGGLMEQLVDYGPDGRIKIQQ
ncbi:hypothetical protein [Flavobacterium ginsenosidimutans]|uniref:SnoaL-like domain-containing protein n=1 Tax=Flavobacterium ginsenosidimutans TaxID=687844 RepID=A0ABZ2Q287_9FLAO